MKQSIGYCINEDIKNEIIQVKNLCNNMLNNYEIFLFGSIAKGKYKKDSDMDILILLEEKKEVKELRLLRHILEDEIEKLNLTRDVDIKIYSKKRYLQLSEYVSFEQAIKEDLIDIRSW